MESEGVRKAFEAIMRTDRRAKSPPLIVPISDGWDSRPWHGEEALVWFGGTPQNFHYLQDAKGFLGKFVPQGKALPIAIVEAWNE